MDDSFDARVKRLFGSRLFDAVPGSSFPTASWTVAAGEVERHRWNREDPDAADREGDPCASAFDEGGCFEKTARVARRRRRDRSFEDDFDDFDDDDDEEESHGGRDGEDGDRGDDGDREEREIRNSVGLDPALDYEEEEDEYDRTALNHNNTGDRVYMRDVKDHGPHLNFHAVVPDFVDDPSEEVHDFSRDPRADHLAANARLKEDKMSVQSGHASLVRIDEENRQDMHTTIDEDVINLKSILKRKQSQIDPKPKKRVRFDTGCDDNNSKTTEEQEDSDMVPQVVSTTVGETSSQMREVSPNIPDYLRNPSKYTRYTLDWSTDDDNETNKKAFEDFKNLVDRANSDQMTLKIPEELPKSITFTPQKKKSHDAMSIDSGSADTNEEPIKEQETMAYSTGIAAGYLPGNEAYEMEEDETCVAEVSISARKTDRKYRSKSSSGDS